ncbi:MAG: fibronectin type III domain-containing protein, partial [Rhodobacteraceae bacterium]|nr:fibronectin type III domain-containing protein [Paracoccaceae bacterium]
SHTIRNLTNGTQYTLVVRAWNDGGQGAGSTVTATPLWPAPTGLEVEPGDGQVTLQWDTGDAEITRYAVFTYYLHADPAVDHPLLESFLSRSVPQMTLIIPGLVNGIDYKFRVAAAVTSNETSRVIGVFSEVFARPVSVPAAPMNLEAMPANEQVTLDWDDPNDDTITKYEISTDGGTSFSDIPDSAPGKDNATSYTILNLTSGTAYPLKLRAENASGEGPAASKTATPIAVPAVPTISEVEPGDREVVLTWEDPIDDSITHYEVSTD